MACVLAFIAIILLGTFPGWHEETDLSGQTIEVKPFPSRPVIQAVMALLRLAALASGVSALWQHVAAVAAADMVEFTTYDNVKAAVGTISMILSWTGLGMLVLTLLGMDIMDRSIRALSTLTAA